MWRTVDLIELAPPPRDAGIGTVAVHDACHHLHAQGLEPRALLRDAGATCVELGDGGRCCGAAGLYSVLQPELAGRLRRQKAEAIAATGAPVVAVANPGCAIQIGAGLREIGARVQEAADILGLQELLERDGARPRRAGRQGHAGELHLRRRGVRGRPRWPRHVRLRARPRDHPDAPDREGPQHQPLARARRRRTGDAQRRRRAPDPLPEHL